MRTTWKEEFLILLAEIEVTAGSDDRRRKVAQLLEILDDVHFDRTEWHGIMERLLRIPLTMQ